MQRSNANKQKGASARKRERASERKKNSSDDKEAGRERFARDATEILKTVINVSTVK